jgi:hypothetical protein
MRALTYLKTNPIRPLNAALHHLRHPVDFAIRRLKNLV